MVQTIALMYHDVVERADDESGFAGAGAALYKLTRDDFAAHLRAIANVVKDAPTLAHELTTNSNSASHTRWLITFDDGGASFHAPIADMLEELNWRGHFFITTDRIGTPAFLTRAQISDLHRRGHIIGSHSCTHPTRMSECDKEQLRKEWSVSIETLSEIVGEKVSGASVPGGYFSNAVAETAAETGVEILFTSEPTMSCERIANCLVVGRYAMQRHTSPDVAASLVAGDLTPRMKQALLWNAKKIAKKLGGAYYLKAQRLMLDAKRAKGATDIER